MKGNVFQVNLNLKKKILREIEKRNLEEFRGEMVVQRMVRKKKDNVTRRKDNCEK